jgi:UDP-hydrolysing UDP-N-acetyl-D-glucosamine 2-epimerase
LSRKPRICVVVTARASWARVQAVVEALRQAEARGRCAVEVVWAGSACLPEYGDVSLPGDTRIHNVIAGTTGETMGAETGLLAIHLSAHFARVRPDLVAVVADRHEVLAPALAAAFENIPVAHLLAGERTGSIDDRVRDAVSMLSSLFFPPTLLSGARLADMGVRGPILVHGCPSIDLCARVERGAPKPPSPIVVVQHAVTTESRWAYTQAQATCAAIRERTEPVVWLWPGEDAGGGEADRAIRQLAAEKRPNIAFRRHIPVMEFLTLLTRAAVIVGNSSVGIRECSFLGTPAVNIGTRQTGRERADNAIDVSHDADEIAAAIESQVDHGPYLSSTLYGDGTAGPKIAHSILEFLR